MHMPMLGCPDCGYLVALDADWCPRCERTLAPAKMREAWERTVHSSGISSNESSS